MQPVPAPLSSETSLNDLVRRFSSGAVDALPVVDAAGAYRGMVTAHEVEAAIGDGAPDVTAGDLAFLPASVSPETTLEGALSQLVQQDQATLPVLMPGTTTVLGWLTHRDILLAYNARLDAGKGETVRAPGSALGPETGVVDSVPTLPMLQDYRLVDVEISNVGPPVGSRIADLALPSHSLLVGLRRRNEAVLPTDDMTVRRGDRLTVLVRVDQAAGLVDRLHSTGAPKPDPPRRD
jgi:CIC family chloride channel protein